MAKYFTNLLCVFRIPVHKKNRPVGDLFCGGWLGIPSHGAKVAPAAGHSFAYAVGILHSHFIKMLVDSLSNTPRGFSSHIPVHKKNRPMGDLFCGGC